MSTKRLLSEQFMAGAKAALGADFTQLSSDTLIKVNDNDVQFTVRFNFVGSAIIQATCYVGARIPEVEKQLSSLNKSLGLGVASPKNQPTVFQDLRASSRIICGTALKDTFTLDQEAAPVEEFHSECFRKVVGTFSEIGSVANYSLQDNSLAIGHHAYRVPLVLRHCGLVAEAQSYMARVLSTGFIQDYEKFVDGVRSQK